MPPCKVKFNTSAPTTPRLLKLPNALAPSKSHFRLSNLLCTEAPNTWLPLMPSLTFVITSIVTCTKPLTSRVKEDKGLKLPFATVPYTPGVKTMVRCAIGAARPVTKSRSVIPLAIANTAYNAVMTEQTAFILTTCATSLKTARFTPLTPTSNVVTALPLMMTLTSKGR